MYSKITGLYTSSQLSCTACKLYLNKAVFLKKKVPTRDQPDLKCHLEAAYKFQAIQILFFNLSWDSVLQQKFFREGPFTCNGSNSAVDYVVTNWRYKLKKTERTLESLSGQFICFRGTQLRQSYCKSLIRSGHHIIGHLLAFTILDRILEYKI